MKETIKFILSYGKNSISVGNKLLEKEVTHSPKYSYSWLNHALAHPLLFTYMFATRGITCFIKAQ